MDFAASSFDYVNQNTVHPLGLAALAVACILVALGPIRLIPLILIGLAVYIPSAQRLVLGGADFPFLRLVILVAIARLLLAHRLMIFRIGAMDLLVFAGASAKLLLMPAVTGDLGILVQQVGSAIDTVGMYLVARATIRSVEDITALASRAFLVCLPVAAVFAIERATGRNMLSVFGGIPLFTDVREGRLRCQGAFQHAILAGCYFVALLPLWLGLWRTSQRARWTAIGGTLLTVLIVFTTASSTPVAALLFVAFAFIAYTFWMHLRLVWLAAIVVAVALHFIMERGIWHVIARIDLVGGSTGWHRYHLIEQAINHLGEWWAVGTLSTRHWGWGLQDVTNQYLLEGVRGGVWAMFALMATIVLGLRACGFWLRRLPPGSAHHLVVYGIGASLFAQAAIFLAVSYFGQNTMIWYLTIALGAFLAESAAVEVARTRAAQAQAVDRAMPVARAAARTHR